jgi:Animal haem peroxidase
MHSSAPGSKPTAADGYHDALRWRILRALAAKLDRTPGWDRLPTPLGLATLVGLRDAMRRNNLYSTNGLPVTQLPPLASQTPTDLTTRTPDGSYNDLENPRAGMAGSRFGRNVRLEAARTPSRHDVLEPNPRRISLELMTREELIAAESVNALVAAWLQWMIRDWFSHGKSPTDTPWQIELAEDDPWPQRPMTIMRTPDDPTRPPGQPTSPPTFVNTSTHWWDASQIYGTTLEYQQAARSGQEGKLRLNPDGSLPVPQGDGSPTQEPGFWLGLVMMQTIFTREHNAVCDMLLRANPSFSDEETFQRARLVIAALIAKIHTTEWTPAVISHPTTVIGMRANWWGLAGERLANSFGRISDSEVINGIVGGTAHNYGVPYALTEEFTAVYRMHPLMPDVFHLRALADDGRIREATLREMAGANAIGLLGDVAMSDLLYSFGTLHPGLVTLHNFPNFLQEFLRPDGNYMDLAATDIVRHRELGVPRYCEFRRQLGLAAPTSFRELADDPETAETIKRLYSADIEQVDLIVGLFGERRPAGFAFGDTAFRIFLLMASRRLNSDRFLTDDFRPAVYTPAGMRWIADNTMTTVLLRHFPELRPALRSVTNAFFPWQRSGVRLNHDTQ